MFDRITVISVAICFVAYTIGHIIEVLMLKGNKNANELSLKFNVFLKYADAFVTWAKEFMPNSTGAEKMSAVIKQLQNIANKYNMIMSEDEITAIAQKSYEAMKAAMGNNESSDPVEDENDQVILEESMDKDAEG